MAKRVFFSFHYQDVIDFRANVVRNHWLLKPDREASGFFDASIWEEAKKTSDLALKRLINSGLNNTSATCVLIGSDTYKRPWVRYEIFKSIDVGNKIIGVHINKIKGKDQKIKSLGTNPFEWLGLQFNSDGKIATPIFYDGSAWVIYSQMDAIKLSSAMKSEYCNKRYKLSHFFPTYCWVDNIGYDNFSDWIS